jgi:hypothetical protein
MPISVPHTEKLSWCSNPATKQLQQRQQILMPRNLSHQKATNKNDLCESLSKYDKYLFFEQLCQLDESTVFCEYKESQVAVQTHSVKGRLKSCISFWKDTIRPSYNEIISFIEQVYVIPFVDKPQSFYLKNNKSALKNKEFVDSAIQDLLDKNCVYETFYKPYNINPLSVA